MERRQFAAVALIAVVLVSGFGIFRWRTSAAVPKTEEVQTSKVETGVVAPTLAVTGYVSSVDRREINSSGSGPVLEVLATVGETVSAGESLVKLEKGTPGQTVNIAYAELTSARGGLQKVLDAKASDDEIAAQEEAVDEAEAEYSRSVDNRYSTIIYSPIAGTVIAVNAQIGDEPGGGSSSGSAGGAQSSGLITVADLSRLQVEAAIDQADISKVAIGQPVEVALDALPNEKFDGQVSAIDPVPSTNQNVVTYTVYVSIDELDPGMRLGMSADLEIALDKHEDVLFVPNVAIRTRANGQFVSKMVDGEPTEVAVKTGLVAGDRTEIVSGLREGDDIVLQSFTATGNQGATGGGSPFGGGFGRGFGGPRR